MTLQALPAAIPGAKPTLVPWERVDQFVGQLTHDVRNGLNALELQLTFLAEVSTDPEAIDEVKRIRQTLADLTRQLQAVRDATGTVALHKLDYPAQDFFEDLQERFERNNPAAKDRVSWQIGVGSELLAIDPEMTMAALLELLANASHFGGAGATMVLAAAMNGPQAIVTVREPRAETPAVSAGEWGRTPLLSSRRGAYGLGLYRVRRIIETQGGRFDVEHSAADEMLVSTVTLLVTGAP